MIVYNVNDRKSDLRHDQQWEDSPELIHQPVTDKLGNITKCVAARKLVWPDKFVDVEFIHDSGNVYRYEQCPINQIAVLVELTAKMLEVNAADTLAAEAGQ